jgi:hypothetical protein
MISPTGGSGATKHQNADPTRAAAETMRSTSLKLGRLLGCALAFRRGIPLFALRLVQGPD